MKKIIVRFPPSPTGKLHLGTARTALFNYLFAQKNNGEIVFRWEDTDKERSKTEFEIEILDGLKWLGINFEKIAKFERQTERLAVHTQILQDLWEKGKVFPCFCMPEEADFIRQKDEKKVFWSPFRNADKEELQAKMDAGEKFVWRVLSPKNRDIIFNDEVRGEVKINTNTIGDFAVARADGSVLYLLANVIDDRDQGITHIIRGEDGLPNTPKQILLFEALESEIPVYAHIPLVLDSKKRKLSKRNVEPGICVLIPDFQESGFLPEAVINGLAFLGWHPKTTEEMFSLEELENIFDLKNVNPAGGQFNFEKFKFFNKNWLKKLPVEDLIGRYKSWVKAFEPTSEKYLDASNFDKAFALVAEKGVIWTDFSPEFAYLLADPDLDKKLLENEKFGIDADFAQKMLIAIQEMLSTLSEADFQRGILREKAIEKIKELGVKNGQFLWPFRVALANQEKSSGPFEIAEVLGKDETLRRIKRALA